MRARRLLGLALLASAVLLLGFAVLFWIRVLPVSEVTRPLLTSVLFLAAVADAVIGARFLGSSDL